MSIRWQRGHEHFLWWFTYLCWDEPDINEFSDIVVEFGQRKRGRVITHFQFKIAKKRGKEIQERLPINGKPKIYTREDLEKDSSLARPGETYEQALRRLNTK